MRTLISTLSILAAIALASPAFAGDDGPGQAKDPVAAPTAADFDKLMNEALGLQFQGQREQAVERLQAAAALRPESTKPYERMCTLLYGGGDLQQAIAACRGWLEREPARTRHGQIQGLLTSLERRLGQSALNK